VFPVRSFQFLVHPATSDGIFFYLSGVQEQAIGAVLGTCLAAACQALRPWAPIASAVKQKFSVLTHVFSWKEAKWATQDDIRGLAAGSGETTGDASSGRVRDV
jgi:hypothetical protein